jgi:GGDEF domain-containing protein
MSAAPLTVPQAGCGSARPPAPRKRVAQMTEEEKTRALLVDELTGLGNRRAWEDRERLPVVAVFDVEGLKWVNDNVGWPAGDELLRAVAAAICAEGVHAYRLGGDEFVFEGGEESVVAVQIEQIRGRLREGAAHPRRDRPVARPGRLRAPRREEGRRCLGRAGGPGDTAARAGRGGSNASLRPTDGSRAGFARGCGLRCGPSLPGSRGRAHVPLLPASAARGGPRLRQRNAGQHEPHEP